MLPTLHITQDLTLPDTDQWQFRFQVKSASSNRLYTVAQHKTFCHDHKQHCQYQHFA